MNLTSIYYARNPQGLRQIFKRVPPPSALQLACADLEQCRTDRLEADRLAEQYDAERKMLEAREKRLLADIDKLRGNPVEPT